MVPRTHGPLRRGNGPDEHWRVIRRTRRMPPALPARRGMLAPWFRRRAAADGDHHAPPGSEPEHASAVPERGEGEAPGGDGADERERPVRRVVAAIATYGQRVF